MTQHPPELYYIRIHEDGSFVNVDDKSLYVQQGSTVRVILTLRQADMEPMVLVKKKKETKQKDKVDHILKEQIYGARKADLPLKISKQFLTIKFDTLEFAVDDQGDYYCEVLFKRSGSQFFRLIYFKDDKIVQLGVPNFFIVQPISTLESLTIQTVLPYSLGPFEHWKQQLESQIAMGYKAFHFPPIQKLGQSGSLYSISNQDQLNPNLFHQIDEKHVAAFFDNMHKEHGTLFFVDILLNHTAFDSEWLGKPEFKSATYNQENTPHMNCAIELDQAIADFSNALGNKKVQSYPFGNQIMNENDLNQIMQIMENEIIRPLNLQEYFQIDIDAIIKKIQDHLKDKKLTDSEKDLQDDEDDDNIFIKNPRELFKILIQDNICNLGHNRNGVAIRFDVVMAFLHDQNHYQKVSVQYLRSLLTDINKTLLQKAYHYIEQAIESTRGQIKWGKLESNDHTIVATYKGDSLVPRYFTKLSNGMWAANNGWIQDYDPLKNFAESGDHHYFKRSIIIWGDLVKLRYGTCKQDSPALWSFMKKYVQKNAKMFNGLRLDNAHSTSTSVGGYMMRKGRLANQNLLIFAELFSGSSYIDSLFTKQLGLNGIVREVNRIDDASTLNSILHFHSGNGKWAVGSLPMQTEVYGEQRYTLLRSQYAPSLVYEQSHDNESLIHSHGFKHQLPISALIAFSKCMKGTVRGYDQYLEKRLSVVSERRQYLLPCGTTTVEHHNGSVKCVQFRLDLNFQAKIVQIKGSFNNWTDSVQLNLVEGRNGIYSYENMMSLLQGDYEYRYLVDDQWWNPSDKQYNENGNHVLSITKPIIRYHNSMEAVRKVLCETAQELEKTYPFIYVGSHNNSVVQINRFSQDFMKSKVVIAQPEFKSSYESPVIELPGILQNVDKIFYNFEDITFSQSENQLLPANVAIVEHQNLLQYCDIYYNHEKRVNVLKFTNLPKSLVIILSCVQEAQYEAKIKQLSEIDYHSDKLYSETFQHLSANDINSLLFCSEAEEQELNNHGLFDIPNYGKLPWAGIYGPLQPFRVACGHNNLGHPICENLRQGNWLIDYLTQRLEMLKDDSSKSLKQFINDTTELIKQAPRYLIPYYFAKFLEGISYQVLFLIQQRSVPWIKNAPFFRNLAVANFQFVSQIPSAQFDNYKTSMSAGHPHFSTGWQRAWGRDTFVAFKGALLLTGMVKEAHEIILQFASCMRHGLLPNLLDAGGNCRYNNRDACWWFIKAIKDYIEHTGDTGIWKQKIKMRFLDNDQEKHYEKVKLEQTLFLRLQDIVQNIFESHAFGIQFREWKAGTEIDRQMQSEGFNINLKMDEETGFIVGGNYRNCLTWMDKMGSSEKAGNKGFPATSRDGAPIEMTALLKCALDFVHKQSQQKFYDYDCVVKKNQKKLTFKQWSDFIAQNFERNYWIPKDSEQFHQYNIIDKYVRQKQIYKDLAKSSKPRNDYQLRPNACIAIAIAPELFNPVHAKIHLATTEFALIDQKSLGMKTLDKIASEYSSFYDNANDSDDFKIAQGFSYHNGPEWVWVYGFFLKALTAVYKIEKPVFYSYLANHKTYIYSNEWSSLPELTNSNGEHNHFSCPAQAWSVACILEAIGDFHNKK